MQTTNSVSVATGLMMSLCSCCRTGGCADDPCLKTFTDRPVKCVDCGEMCTCEGCIAEVDPTGEVLL